MNFAMNFTDWSRAFLSTVSGHTVLERLFFASVEFAAIVLLVWLSIRVARIKSARLMSLLWLVALAKPIVSLGLGSPLPVLKLEIAKSEVVTSAEGAIEEQFSANQSSLPIRPLEAVADSRPEPFGQDFPDRDFSFMRNPDEALYSRSVPSTESDSLPAVAPTDANALPTATESAPLPAPSRWNAATIVISLWLAGVALFVWRSALDRFRLRRLIYRASPPEATLSSRYAQLAAAFRIRHAPRLRVTDELESPALVGSLLPTVLIPRWLVSERDGDKIDWALRHELMHWKLFDTHAGLVREIAQALFYFHPAVWWAGRQWEVAAELACDRAIITDDAQSHDYAAQLYGMLVEIRDRRRFPVKSGLFATRTQIMQRIAALVHSPCRTRAHLGAFALVAVAAVSLAALTIGGTFAEKDPQTDTLVTSDETPGPDSPLLDPAVITEPEKSKDDAPVIVRGRVLDPDGKPVAGAAVYGIRTVNAEQVEFFPVELLTQTKSAADGRFAVSLPIQPPRSLDGSKFVERNLQVVAIADGYGLDWEGVAPELPDKELTLRLVHDSTPIEGRVLSLEGRPLAGVRVRVEEVLDPTTAAIDEWLAEVGLNPGRYSDAELQEMTAANAKGGRRLPQFPGGKALCTDAFAAIPAAVTGQDGRFQIAGLGKDRKITLALDGESIAKTWLESVTRQMKVVPLPYHDPRFRAHNYFGAAFDYTAEPTQIIAGVVRDADSKQPLNDIAVGVCQFAGSNVYSRGFLSARTDAQGRYRIVGLPKVSRDDRGPMGLQIQPPPAQPYFQTRVDVPLADGLAPVEFDVELKQAVWLTGRIADQQTGKPIAALVSYYPFLDNPHAREYANFDPGMQGLEHEAQYPTSTDGSYRLPAIHGRGVVMAVALDDQVYRVAAGGEEIGWKSRRSSNDPRLVYYIWGPDRANSLRPVNIDAAAAGATRDIDLIPLESQSVRLRDPDGRALSNVIVGGLLPRPPMFRGYNGDLRFQPICSKDQAVVMGLETDRRRMVLMLHPQRCLGHAGIVLHQTTNEIRLLPCATISGRVITATGKPVAKTWVSATIADSEFPDPTDQVGWRYTVRNARSDDDGRFELDMVLPGVRYKIHIGDGATADVALVKPGESIDLGSLTATAPDEKTTPEEQVAEQAIGSAPTRPLDPPANRGNNDTRSVGADKTTAPSQSTGRAEVGVPSGQTSSTTVSITGVVLKPDGSPAAGATVRAATPLWAMLEPIVGTDFKAPMSEAKADAQGKFSISFPTQPFGDLSQLDERWREMWKKTDIAASLAGFGPAWVSYDEINSPQPVKLRLVEDLPIRGRVVDLEGRPVADTSVKVSGPRTSKDDNLTAWIEGIKAGELPWIVYQKASRSVDPRLAGTPTLATTDGTGKFEIHGLGRERIVDLTFEGESVAHRAASAVTRSMPSTRRTISTPPFEGFQSVFGAEFTFTADPARTIEGVVRDAKSGEHLAGVSVESDKLVGYPYYNHRVLKTKTDKLGRFRMIGMPKGAGNKLLLVPNDEQPYFMRAVEVPDPVGLGPAKMEIELHRGIWITGRVTDKATGQPVPGVRLYYLPFRTNEYAQRTPEFNPNGNVDGDQARYVANPDGTYRLVGLPGRAIVGAESVLKDYCRGVGYDAIDAPKVQNTDHFDTYRNPIDPSPKWPSVMREINPAADAQSVTLDLQLDPGRSLRIRLVAPGGEPLTGVSVTGLGSSGYRKASQEPVLVAVNFGPAETRTVLFHHEERKIGRVVTIGPKQLDAAEMTVELQPCATVVGRILNSDGLPISGMAIRPDVLPSGDFSKHLPNVATDAEGRFRVTLLPGCQYSFGGEGGGFQFVTVARDLSIEPGETKDLGTLTIDKDGKVVPQDRTAPAIYLP